MLTDGVDDIHFSDKLCSIESLNKLYGTRNDLFLLHINICSLSKNFEDLEEIISQLDKSPEIIALSETRLKTDNTHHIKGYTFIQTNSTTNAGGVGAYIKENINFSIKHDLKLNASHTEDIWIEVTNKD